MGRTSVRPGGLKPAPRTFWIALSTMVVLTILTFGQVVTHAFVAYDDGQFVLENPAVRAGLTAQSVRWAFTSTQIGYYPLTWLSHMLDVQIWGLHAGGHLATALLLHILSSCLLFLALRRLTGRTTESALVAALFAIHPAHVESVAWVSERKDTLSTLFGMLALFLYARPRTIGRDAGVAAAFAASLLAKQMLVTLPFVFLLIDWWPLKRRPTVVDKLPLFALSAGGCLLAVIGQRNLGAIQNAPLASRIANALVAYVRYLGELVWPVGLAPIYPLMSVGSAPAIGAFVLLLAITAGVWIARRRAPWLLMGWLWFLGTLVPVIGLVQIGATSIADRYTYFPFIGLFVAIVWQARQLMSERSLQFAGAALVVVLGAMTAHQVGYWKNTDTLFTHTLAVTGPNPVAEYTLGQALQTSDPDRALPHLKRAIELTAPLVTPGSRPPEIYAQSYVALGTALLMKARATPDAAARLALVDEATTDYQTALRIDPHAPHAANNLRYAAAMRAAIQPPQQRSAADALIDKGVALDAQRRYPEAVELFRQAVAADPRSIGAHIYLGIALAQIHDNAGAVNELRAAQAIDAKRANDYVTGALRLAPAAENIDRLIRQLGGG